MRDWLVNDPESGQYYQGVHPTSQADLEALGMCLLNCVALNPVTPLPPDLTALLLRASQQFSKEFTLVLAIIARQVTTEYHSIVPLLKKECPITPTLA